MRVLTSGGGREHATAWKTAGRGGVHRAAAFSAAAPGRAPMRVLISGGGREHAMAWKTAQAADVEKVQAAAAFIALRYFRRRHRVGRP